MQTSKINIRDLSIEELKNQFQTWNERPFRATQVYEWLWKKNARDFLQMSNLSQNLRQKLDAHYFIDKIVLSDLQISSDNTTKYAFEIVPGKLVESVLIPSNSRITACISSQVGCSLSCLFCATGKLKLLRNLGAGEIVDQVAFLRDEAEKKLGQPLTNIVYMGMGEPLLNYKNVLRSIHMITSKEGMGMSAKRITVSTAGIAKMIAKLGDDEVKFNLALSLHAANDAKRNQIMEINQSNNLEALTEALSHFYYKTKIRPTLEYILFDQFNDSLDDARELLNFARKIPCKINIIEYNPIENGQFQRANPEQTDAFATFLESRGLTVTVRRSRGKDIDAACGQLANKKATSL